MAWPVAMFALIPAIVWAARRCRQGSTRPTGRVEASGEASARPYAFGGDVGPTHCKPGMNTIRAMDATSKGNHVLPPAGGAYQIKTGKSPNSRVHRRCLMVHLVQLEPRYQSGRHHLSKIVTLLRDIIAQSIASSIRGFTTVRDFAFNAYCGVS